MAKMEVASEKIDSKNKALVLEAFDTLFNKRDYAAAERFWSPDYIQHSAHIAPGREGLFKLIKSLPPTLSTNQERSWLSETS
jgi:predicted SnoaL-like aldol condensation-catalyzing enzyme